MMIEIIVGTEKNSDVIESRHTTDEAASHSGRIRGSRTTLVYPFLISALSPPFKEPSQMSTATMVAAETR